MLLRNSARSLIADSGIVCSMIRSGNVWDKRFFSSLKTERIERKTIAPGTWPEQMFRLTSSGSTMRRRHSTSALLSFERKVGLA